jgi:hypothetical protein
MVEPLKAPTHTFDEPDVGITHYLGDIASPDRNFVTLSCTVKHRFSDFIVNEIDLAGQVVWFQPETDLQKWRKQPEKPLVDGQEEDTEKAQEKTI